MRGKRVFAEDELRGLFGKGVKIFFLRGLDKTHEYDYYIAKLYTFDGRKHGTTQSGLPYKAAL